jgi:hypothetical protein
MAVEQPPRRTPSQRIEELYVVPPGHSPPPDAPAGLQFVRQLVHELDEETRKTLEIPAFLRRENTSPLLSAIDRKRSPLYRLRSQSADDGRDVRPEVEATADAGPDRRQRARQENRALRAFLADLDFSGGRVISRALLAKHGIVIEGETNHSFDIQQAIQQLTALVTALEEAAEYDPVRHHNQPPPALWISSLEYTADQISLLNELRRLNDYLQNAAKVDKPKDVEKSVSFAVVAGKKFVEEYAGVMGKGAAALTICGVAGLFVSLGVDKGTVETIWNLLKPSK